MEATLTERALSLQARAHAEYEAAEAAEQARRVEWNAESEERDRQRYHAALTRAFGVDCEPAWGDEVVTIDGLRFAYRDDYYSRTGRRLLLCGECACGAAVPLAPVETVRGLGSLLEQGYPQAGPDGPPQCADCRQREYEAAEEAAAAAAGPVILKSAPPSLEERLVGLLRELVREELAEARGED